MIPNHYNSLFTGSCHIVRKHIEEPFKTVLGRQLIECLLVCFVLMSLAGSQLCDPSPQFREEFWDFTGSECKP